jgi:hypothetical protein
MSVEAEAGASKHVAGEERRLKVKRKGNTNLSTYWEESRRKIWKSIESKNDDKMTSWCHLWMLFERGGEALFVIYLVVLI